MTIYSRATDRMASNLLRTIFSFAPVFTNSVTFADADRISTDGRDDAGH